MEYHKYKNNEEQKKKEAKRSRKIKKRGKDEKGWSNKRDEKLTAVKLDIEEFETERT